MPALRRDLNVNNRPGTALKPQRVAHPIAVLSLNNIHQTELIRGARGLLRIEADAAASLSSLHDFDIRIFGEGSDQREFQTS